MNKLGDRFTVDQSGDRIEWTTTNTKPIRGQDTNVSQSGDRILTCANQGTGYESEPIRGTGYKRFLSFFVVLIMCTSDVHVRAKKRSLSTFLCCAINVICCMIY